MIFKRKDEDDSTWRYYTIKKGLSPDRYVACWTSKREAQFQTGLIKNMSGNDFEIKIIPAPKGKIIG
jgi:hypothetical protein